MGGSGSVILFVISMAACSAVSAYFVILAARVYLVILQDTAAGIDDVRWPDETPFDWLVSSVYFLGLSALILLPAGLLSRALAETFLPDDKVTRYFLLAAPIWWFFFPIGILSSMSSASQWMILSPRILVGLLREVPMMIGFYLITAALLLVVTPLAQLALFGKAWFMLPVGIGAVVYAWMVHARLVGRMGWVITRHRFTERKPKRSEKEQGGKRPRKKRRARQDAEDPWADPTVDDKPVTTAGTLSYTVIEEPVSPRVKRPRYVDPDPDPYTVSEEPVSNEPPPLAMNAPEEDRVKREIQMRAREAPNPPPAIPLVSGVYQFPLYDNCHRPLGFLLIWGCISGALFRVMMYFSPM